MNKVWFRNFDNQGLFILNTCKHIDTVPLIGDFVNFGDKDFTKATYRLKPHEKVGIMLEFIVVKRIYSARFDSWELICEPTSESLLYLLKHLKTNKK